MRGRAPAALALLAVAGAALLLRAVGLEHAFAGDGPVVLVLGDGAYHARLARWALAHFPSFATWDTYLNAPRGGPVPWPPLFDLAVAAAARAAGGSERALELALAWAAPVCGAFTVLAVYAAARVLAGRGTALAAAALYAGFGLAIEYARIGSGDHHAAAALGGALLLAAALAFVRAAWLGAPLAALALGLALARIGVLLTWPGSLLYLGLGDGLLLLAFAATGRAAALVAQAVSALAAAIAVAPVVLAFDTVHGGPWSAVALSRLHLLVLAGAAALALVTAFGERRRPATSTRARLLRLLAGAVLVALVALVIPGARDALARVLRFLTVQDVTGAATAEQFPLLPLPGRAPAGSPALYFGWLAWLVPLAPLLPLWAVRQGAKRAAARWLAAWSAPLALLTVTQVRYGNELAPALAVCFALGFGRATRALREALRVPPAAAAAIAVAAAGLALGPSLRGTLAGVPASWAWLRDGDSGGDPRLASPAGSLVRFAQEVRRLTPETRGFLEAGVEPEYNVLASGNIGHFLRWYARRPAAMDGFWSYVDAENFARAERFLAARSESEALGLGAALRARYVVTMAGPPEPGLFADRLHREDGLAAGTAPRFEQLRLVTEGPRGGRPLVDAFGVRRPANVVPYKLFEIVEGAVLEVPALPGTQATAAVRIVTPLGRGFDYEARREAGADGMARLRVPYATQSEVPARPAGPWRVRAGDATWLVDTSEAQVRGGEPVRVDAGG